MDVAELELEADNKVMGEFEALPLCSDVDKLLFIIAVRLERIATALEKK
jgi:hypothetical protein